MIATQLGPLDMRDVKLSEVKSLMVKKEEPNAVFVKYSFTDEYRMVQIIKKKKKQEHEVALMPCYNRKIPLAENKKKDLLYLCQKNLIPRSHQGFFTNLS